MQYERHSEDFGKAILEEIAKLEQECKIKLSKAQKAILGEIGTVEQLLSIYADSPIHVELLYQSQSIYASFLREVWLCDQAGKRLVFAKTNYNPDILPFPLRKDMLEGKMGIGSAIRSYKLETYRSIVKLGYDPERRVLYREYAINMGGKPLFKIQEEFSLDLFSDQ